MRRTLRLVSEPLTELTPQQLGDIAGGAITPACPTFEYCRIPTDHCVSLLDCIEISQTLNVCVTYRTACA